MKALLHIILLILACSIANAFPGNPGTGDSILCVHHHQNGDPSESYALVIAPQSCPVYVGPADADTIPDAVSCKELHPYGGAPYFQCVMPDGSIETQSHSSSSQQCWTEEQNMGG